MASVPCGQMGRLVQTWTSLTGPIVPARMISTAVRRPFSAVPWLPIWVATLYFLAASRICRASKTECVNGFWQ